MKLVSEIAGDQQTRTSDQTFEGILDPNRPPVPVVQPSPYLWSFFGTIMPNHRDIPKTKIMCALLVASSLLNSHEVLVRLDKKWLSYERGKNHMPIFDFTKKSKAFTFFNIFI